MRAKTLIILLRRVQHVSKIFLSLRFSACDCACLGVLKRVECGGARIPTHDALDQPGAFVDMDGGIHGTGRVACLDTLVALVGDVKIRHLRA